MKTRRGSPGREMPALELAAGPVSLGRAAGTAELGRGFGLGGRPRRAGSQAERARVNVTQALRSARARTDEVHPEAASHLGAAIRTGTFCVYDPPEPVRWGL